MHGWPILVMLKLPFLALSALSRDMRHHQCASSLWHSSAEPCRADLVTGCRAEAALLSSHERMTAARLRISTMLLSMVQEEPRVLPARVPNLLVNGAQGIAVGIATRIPPHNLREIVAGLHALIDKPDITVKELMERIPAPDFPTGANP